MTASSVGPVAPAAARPVPAVSAASLDHDLIDTRLLDCWEVNIALGLVAVGQRDVRSLLGAQWWFEADRTHRVPDAATAAAIGAGAADPPVQVSLDLEPPLARIARLTGHPPRTLGIGPGLLVPTCQEALAAGAVPVVVADAYDMPWTPYAGRLHVEHSLIVTACRPSRPAGPAGPARAAGGGDPADGGRPGELGIAFTDAYDNRTEWGPAVPMDGFADPSVVARMETAPDARVVVLAGDPTTPAPPVDRSALLAANVAALAAWGKADPYQAITDPTLIPTDPVTFDWFCQLCWTIERRRGLYARWLADLEARPPSRPVARLPAAFATRFGDEVVGRWATVNRFAYLALRRTRAGHGVPAARIADLISAATTAELDLATHLVEESRR